jgi:hypothetical protein
VADEERTYAHDASCNSFHLAGPEPCPLPPETTWKTSADGSRWAITYRSGLEFIELRDGVDWIDAPLPRRWHRCQAQVRGWLRGPVARCACGSISQDGRHWLRRNSRRKP